MDPETSCHNENMSANEPKSKASDEEPFLLSILPFAGLLLLLILALVWRLVPDEKVTPAASDDRVQTVLDRWQRTPREDVDAIAGRDFTLGPNDAPVTIVEYSDFECPYCKTAAADIKHVLDLHGKDVRLVFKNMPLDMACNDQMHQQLHPHACEAAELARCAGAQGAELFWKAHDALFRANGLSPATLESIPKELDLSQDAFESCMASNQEMDAIRADVASAYAVGVTGTPTFFVDGRKVYDYRDGALARVVARALSEK
jgi:predicted DsbA family dithiol-disulfide isomerase